MSIREASGALQVDSPTTIVPVPRPEVTPAQTLMKQESGRSCLTGISRNFLLT